MTIINKLKELAAELATIDYSKEEQEFNRLSTEAMKQKLLIDEKKYHKVDVQQKIAQLKRAQEILGE